MDRVLVIESCQRAVCERFLTVLYRDHIAERVDVLTCYGGAPRNFDASRGTVLSIHDGAAASNRMQFLSGLATTGYSVVAVICSGDPIMTKWKWMAAIRIPAKALVVNENAGYFWFDVHNLRRFGRLALSRIEVRPPGVVEFSLPSTLLAYPLNLLLAAFHFVALFAFTVRVHAQRRLRSIFS